ncbi:unknown protein [Oryza sativa Japonica Group]|uniref:Os01g0530100 protein n=2 Tax=Oryza sativa subsp. japonica TaxID=39947 RepID=A0A9K3Y881_ORYSJ|nr:unknown protein [Oryza sativa Japonica Group]BAG98174.1 unnamed protein product [Oryza sativa Japonica Group]BAH91120.1 Os01g0530100 [Oryza sativa Japonica Group]|eukprot:NP_001172390.1 Os01g0530100 [Oryza sativa Japonica Group]
MTRRWGRRRQRRGSGVGAAPLPSLPDPAEGGRGARGGGGGASPPSQIRPEGGWGRAAAAAVTVPLPPRSSRRETGGGRRQRRQSPSLPDPTGGRPGKGDSGGDSSHPS